MNSFNKDLNPNLKNAEVELYVASKILKPYFVVSCNYNTIMHLSQINRTRGWCENGAILHHPTHHPTGGQKIMAKKTSDFPEKSMNSLTRRSDFKKIRF